VAVKKKTGQVLSGKKVESIIGKYKHKPGGLLTILEQVQKQNKNNYLPEKNLTQIAESLGISMARVYSVVTFYSFFNLEPQGDHIITVCRGTACHTRGSKNILSSVSSYLGLDMEKIEQGTPDTTPDFQFTLRSVACFGQCALAPVIEIDGIIYSHVTENQVKTIIDTIRKRS
jgi:NADH-quinone oxidoreductase subunit E